MKLKRIFTLCLAAMMILSLCSCAEKKAAEIESLDGKVEMTVWNSEEGYNYHFCLTDDNVLHTVKYKLPEKNEYTMNDGKTEYAKKTGSVTLTEEQVTNINTTLEGFENFCREKGEYFAGPRVVLTYGEKVFHFTYGQCLDRDFDNLVTALLEYSDLEVTDLGGECLAPTGADTCVAE